MKANYHTHTTRCLHATGTDEEYVLAAIDAGFEELGFADHAPWRYASDFVPSMRMPVEEFSGYIESLRALRDKYRDQIRIKIGLECEYFPSMMPWMQGLADGAQLDYLIFGNHYYGSDEHCPYFGHHDLLDLYLTSMLQGMQYDGFAYVAHPDIYMRSHCVFDQPAKDAARAICKEAKRLNRLLEFNLLGLKKGKKTTPKGDGYYPYPDFWRIAAEEGCRAILGTDAHSPDQLFDDDRRNFALEFLNELGIEVVQTFPMRTKVPASH